MRVEVRVFATLRRHLPDLGIGEARVLEVGAGTTLSAIRDGLGLPPDEVRVVIRNHVQADWDDTVEEGDRIAFVPAVAGG